MHKVNTEDSLNHSRNGPQLVLIASYQAKEQPRAAEIEEFEKGLKIDKMRRNESKFRRINHEAFGIAISNLDGNTHRFAVRYCYRWLPSGARKDLNDPKEDRRCILCGQIQEDSSHFLQCRNAIPKRAFKKMLERVQGTITNIRTPPAIRSIVIRNIKAWHKGISSEKVICDVQELIGWGQFLRGRITQEVARRLTSNDTDQEKSNKKVVKVILTMIKAANDS